MTRQERLSISQEQSVAVATIYQRENYGWTDEEIRRGQRGHKLNLSKFAKENGIPVNRLYTRRRMGWTDVDIKDCQVFDSGCVKYVCRNNINGKLLCLVLIFDVISSIVKSSSKFDNYKMACLVYRGLQDRGV